MDTKFSTAIHTLILITESQDSLSSDQIAASVGTNASYIRKITLMLKKAGIIESHRGISGFSLARNAEDICLLDVLRAVTGDDETHLFDIHQKSSGSSDVGRNIKPVLIDMFSGIEDQIKMILTKETLADCVVLVKKRVAQEKMIGDENNGHT